MLSRLVPPVGLRLRHPWVPGARLEVDARRHPMYWRHGLRGYEPHVARLLAQVVRPSWLSYEVGTHIGFFTILLSRLSRQVVGLEPDLGNLARTARNLARNGMSNVLLVGAAAASRAGVADFTRDPRSGAAGGLREFHHGEHAGGRVSVPTVRLDALARALGAPDLVKVDAEGAEDDVLEGMGDLLEGDVRLLVEVGERTRRPVQDRLRARGFRLFNPHAGMAEQEPGTYAGWHVWAARR